MLIKNTFSFLGVGFLPYLVNFLMLPLYSRYLTPEDFGVIGIVSIFAALFGTWSSLQVPASIGRLYFEVKQKDRNVYFSSIVYGVILISTFFLLANLALMPQIELLMFSGSGEYQKYLLIGVMQIFVTSINQIFERWFIVEKKGSTLLIRNLISQIVNVITGIVLVVYLELGLIGYLGAIIVSQCLLLVLSVIILRNLFIFRLKVGYLKNAIFFSCPLIFHAVGGIVFMYSSTFILEKMVPLSVLGVFVIADKLSQVVKVIVNQLNSMIMPFVIGQSKQDEAIALELIDLIILPWWLLIVIISSSFAVFCFYFIPMFFGEEYKEAAFIVPILVFSYLFRGLYCFSSMPIFYRKDTKKIPFITLAAGLMSIFINICLISQFQLAGAAIATVFSFAVTAAMAHFLSPKNFRVRYDMKRMLLVLSIFPFLLVLPSYFIDGIFHIISLCMTALIILVVIWKWDLLKFKSKLVQLGGLYGQ